MARGKTRPPSRLELRKQVEAAEKIDADAAAEAGVEGAPKKKATRKTATKKSATPRVKKAKKKAEPVRMRAAWGVFDNSNQQIATFPYANKAGAEQKVAELLEKGRGNYFVQPVKEPLPPKEPAAEEAS